MDSVFLKVFKIGVDVAVGKMVSSGIVSAVLRVGLGLKRLFYHKSFFDHVILRPASFIAKWLYVLFIAS